MTTKQKWILGLVSVSCLISFALGRFTVPEKIKTVTVTQTVEKKTDDVKTATDLDKHKQTVQVEVKKPDGTVTVTTTTVEDDQAKRTSDNKSTDNTAQTITATKEITKSSSPVTISALVGAHLTFDSQPLIFGACVTKPMLGPITVGLWGLSNLTGGLSVGVTF